MTEPLIYDLSAPGRCGVVLPDCDVPEADLPPKDLLREDLPLPEVSEIDIVRHYLRLSQMNYGVDKVRFPAPSPGACPWSGARPSWSNCSMPGSAVAIAGERLSP